MGTTTVEAKCWQCLLSGRSLGQSNVTMDGPCEVDRTYVLEMMLVFLGDII